MYDYPLFEGMLWCNSEMDDFTEHMGVHRYNQCDARTGIKKRKQGQILKIEKNIYALRIYKQLMFIGYKHCSFHMALQNDG